jgi:putative addiction module component (TIGR02574 family)
MVQNYHTLLQQALKLSSHEKLHLLSDLFENLLSGQQKEREQLWAAGAERRLAEYDKGNVDSEDWDSLSKRLKIHYSPCDRQYDQAYKKERPHL